MLLHFRDQTITERERGIALGSNHVGIGTGLRRLKPEQDLPLLEPADPP